jgi:hypothetical protein
MVNTAVLFDMRMTDFNVSASLPTLLSKGVSNVCWWFFGHGVGPPMDAVKDDRRYRWASRHESR